MPDRVEPCLALLKPRPPVGPDWTYEVKWDGYRIAVHLNGRLLLAARKGDDWVYVGSVGIGFNARSAEYLRKTFDRIKRKTPPVKYVGRRKNLVWVQPTLIAEIEYRLDA
jgi:ATP-dependent DNA ligase